MDGIPADALMESWESIFEKTVSLAHIIEAACAESGEQFDAIVVIPRGSYYPVNIVGRELGFKATDYIHACIGSYADYSVKQRGQFSLGQMPSDDEVKGKDLLIIDEVCDKGQVLSFLTKRLKKQGAKLVRTGVLHYKPSQSETGFVPDWYISETDRWVVFPWELHDAAGFKSHAKRLRTID